MVSLVRIGFSHILNNGCKNVATNKGVLQIGIRHIISKTSRTEPRKPKPAPWPYKDKKFTFFNSIYDKTTSRFDENTKLIVVEGPPAAGKTKFAKELAEELEMLYFPEANLDMIYTNDYGYNLKQLDEQLPETCRSFDIKDFLINPKHRLTANFQIKQYSVKYSQYIDALAHVLSTGQGVVLDRSVYSDFAFAEAMYSQGYISALGRSGYYETRDNSIGELLRPHLIIYLDVPVNKVIENIKKRNITCEVNSSVLSPQYLSVLEKYYKQHYLKEASPHSELLIYDWSTEGEVEVVVEDIERINFVRTDIQDTKFADWIHYREEEYGVLRYTYAVDKSFLMTYLNIPLFNVPELVIPAEDFKEYLEVLENAPGMLYAKGYNKSMGDSTTFFKTGLPFRVTLPSIERKLT